MKLKRILALLLVCIFVFSLVSCDTSDTTDTSKDTTLTDEQNTDDSGEKEPANNDKPTEEPKVIVTKTYNFADILDKVKVFGRSSTVGTGIACDHVASGIEFNAYIEGKLTINISVAKGTKPASISDNPLNDDCYFTLYVDGVRSETRFKAVKNTTTTLELADFTEGGVHNVRLIKQTEPRNGISVLSNISFTGYFESKPADTEYYVEFVGDSITAGYGNLTDKSQGAAVAQTAANQDATKSFAYLTAQKLGVDHTTVSTSGIGVAQGWRGFTMKDLYGANSFYRSQTETYTPTRTPDVVVINLGTNDESKSVSATAYKEAVRQLILQVRMAYGENVPIVWAYGMMSQTASYVNSVQSAMDELGGEASGLYMCKLTYDRDAGGGHPDLAAHEASSTTLANFINSKIFKKS